MIDAIGRNDAEHVRQILSTPNSVYTKEAYFTAISQKSLEIEQLLREHINVDFCVWEAVNRGNLTVLKFLTPLSDTNTLLTGLYAAVEHGYVDIVSHLLEVTAPHLHNNVLYTATVKGCTMVFDLVWNAGYCEQAISVAKRRTFHDKDSELWNVVENHAANKRIKTILNENTHNQVHYDKPTRKI